MNLYQNNIARKLKATAPVLDTVPKAEKLLDKEQNDVNEITEELANEYFKAMDSSVLPF